MPYLFDEPALDRKDGTDARARRLTEKEPAEVVAGLFVGHLLVLPGERPPPQRTSRDGLLVVAEDDSQLGDKRRERLVAVVAVAFSALS